MAGRSIRGAGAASGEAEQAGAAAEEAAWDVVQAALVDGVAVGE